MSAKRAQPSAQQPAEPPAEQAVERPVERPAEQRAEPPAEQPADEPTAAVTEGPTAPGEPAGPAATDVADEIQLIDVISDDLALARAQLDAGLAALAEGHLRRRVARLETEGPAAAEELDAARCLLAEALWRQQRPLAAGAVLEAIRGGSRERRRPIALLIEAEARAAAGDPDRARALLEEVVSAVGVDQAWLLRGGAPTRLSWPLPAVLRPPGKRGPRPAWSPGPSVFSPPPGEVPPERTAAAHSRLQAARRAYAADDLAHGDRELGLALRLDAAVAADGVRLMEPTLTAEAATDRLLLYGDLLRAAGRHAEASVIYDRAAET